VNVTTEGMPYYAAVVINSDAETVTVFFPNSADTSPYTYKKKFVKAYNSQVINGKFRPLKWRAKDLNRNHRKLIKQYEENVQKYLNK